jgi:hypothetical protein
MNGKAATIKALAYPLPQVMNSTYWNIGKFADSGEANIGQGYGILAEGEGNITLHMKMPDDKGLRTLTDAEINGATNMTYKEGPKCLTWYANGQNLKTGSFTVTGATATFKLTADIAGKPRALQFTTAVKF